MSKEIERQIEEISSSAIEFRKSIDRLIFRRLKDYFKTKGKKISRNSELKDLLGGQFTSRDWYELENIGLKIPKLRRHKAFKYMTAGYVLIAVITSTVTVLTNLDKIFVVWSLPLSIIASVMFTLTFSPILIFIAIFKKRFLPVCNVDDFVDGIIAENWSDLLTDNKRLFKELLRQELTSTKRASA